MLKDKGFNKLLSSHYIRGTRMNNRSIECVIDKQKKVFFLLMEGFVFSYTGRYKRHIGKDEYNAGAEMRQRKVHDEVGMKKIPRRII